MDLTRPVGIAVCARERKGRNKSLELHRRRAACRGRLARPAQKRRVADRAALSLFGISLTPSLIISPSARGAVSVASLDLRMDISCGLVGQLYTFATNRGLKIISYSGVEGILECVLYIIDSSIIRYIDVGRFFMHRIRII